MAVLKEWTCAAHGAFEASVSGDEVAKCPKGCPKRFVKREFRTAPAVGTVVKGRLDSLQRGLAHDFGLSDLKSGRDDGKSVMQNLGRDGKPKQRTGNMMQDLRSGEIMQPEWGGMELNHLKPGWSQRGEKPMAVTPGKFGMKGGHAIADVGGVPKQLPAKIEGRVAKPETWPE
jgi:hypothetical protein